MWTDPEKEPKKGKALWDKYCTQNSEHIHCHFMLTEKLTIIHSRFCFSMKTEEQNYYVHYRPNYLVIVWRLSSLFNCTDGLTLFLLKDGCTFSPASIWRRKGNIWVHSSRQKLTVWKQIVFRLPCSKRMMNCITKKKMASFNFGTHSYQPGVTL